MQQLILGIGYAIKGMMEPYLLLSRYLTLTVMWKLVKIVNFLSCTRQFGVIITKVLCMWRPDMSDPKEEGSYPNAADRGTKLQKNLFLVHYDKLATSFCHQVAI